MTWGDAQATWGDASATWGDKPNVTVLTLEGRVTAMTVTPDATGTTITVRVEPD